MRKTHRLMIATAGAVVALAAMPVTAHAAPGTGQTGSTAAGGCSSFPPTPCGEVQNNSSRSVRVSLNWTCDASTAVIGSSCPQSIRTVGSGKHIGGGSVDVDAFEVPNGCTFKFDIDGLDLTRGPGWYKFSSLNTVTIHSASC